MPRLARLVVPNIPHHIVQRGNRKMDVFFQDEDYQTYIDLIAAYCQDYRAEVLAWCLMPNHVHFVVVPREKETLHKVFGETHRRYTQLINKREGWTGYLWQGRFSSFPMDEQHLMNAVAYVELNPVAAGLVRRPEDWRWSSARAHLKGVEDPLMGRQRPKVFDGIRDWRAFLKQHNHSSDFEVLEKHERTGRPVGDKKFIRRLEKLTGRALEKQKPGPKSKK